MLVHERLNNIGEPVFKNSYLRQMDPSVLNRISEILHQLESASYVRKVFAVVLLVFVAFLLNSVVGRLLEKLRRVLMRRVLGIPLEEGGDDIAFGLDLAFGLANLTCTALLAWQVHDISIWILQTSYESSQVN